MDDTSPKIGTLNERPLHASLKAWYATPSDRSEVRVDGRVIDLVRGDLLIEIQTRQVSAIRSKLARLVEQHPLRLVIPVAQEKWIVRLDADGHPSGRRKSPRHGSIADIVAELASIPTLLDHPHFALEVLLIHEEEWRRQDPRHGWRRGGWVTHERHLLAVVGQHRFDCAADLLMLLPADLAQPFTTAEIATLSGRARRWGQQLAYCLRVSGQVRMVGKRGRALLYERTAP